jgi:tRNA 2-selenouridine synthase
MRAGLRFIVLRGLAGSGKTAMLARLVATGEQAVDLEELAAHRGSAYGRIGILRPQPSTAEFGAAVATALNRFDPGRPVWLEDEGPFIGAVSLPAELVTAMAGAEVAEVTRSWEDRVERLISTYVSGDPKPLIAATNRIRRRLGTARTDRVISFFNSGRSEAAITTLLDYFDHAYAHRAAVDQRPTADGPSRLVADLGTPESSWSPAVG